MARANEGFGAGITFKETQRFRQWWVVLLVLGVAAITWIMAFVQLILGQKVGNRPASDLGMVIIWVVFGVAFPYFFFSIKLDTQVRADGLYWRFFPIHLAFRKIAFTEIADAQATTYNSLREYGGWGIRFGAKGMAVNISGNQGVRLLLVSGKQILFGSQRASEFFQAIQNERWGRV